MPVHSEHCYGRFRALPPCQDAGCCLYTFDTYMDCAAPCSCFTYIIETAGPNQNPISRNLANRHHFFVRQVFITKGCTLYIPNKKNFYVTCKTMFLYIPNQVRDHQACLPSSTEGDSHLDSGSINSCIPFW
jgi:hypothetical protein